MPQWGNQHPDRSAGPGSNRDPFGGADPFAGPGAADPFGSADPFGGAGSAPVGSDPFGGGGAPQPGPPLAPAVPPAPTPPPADDERTQRVSTSRFRRKSAAPPTTAPSPTDTEKTVRINRPAGTTAAPAAPGPIPGPVPSKAPRSAPAASSRPLAGYLLAGVASVVLTVAIATLLALPELNMFYGQVTTAVVIAAAGLIVAAAALLWQASRCARGKPHAQLYTLIACALTVLAAVLVWIFGPGAQVSWFSTLIRVAGVLGGIGAAATAALLQWRGTEPAAAHASSAQAPQGTPEPAVAPPTPAAFAAAPMPAPVPQRPTATHRPPSSPPPPPSRPPSGDFDPFS